MTQNWQLEFKLTVNISGCYPPGYLADPAESQYGNNAFSINLEDILSDYMQSRPDKEGKAAFLKMGGTLRYQHEICYVVIVCMEGDMEHIPSITGPTPPFYPNGLVDNHGRVVVDRSATPTFTIKSILKSVPKVNEAGYDKYDWEQLVFSFYYPTEDQALVCTKVNISEVKHQMCTSTMPNPAGGRWVCPNKLGLPKKTE